MGLYMLDESVQLCVHIDICVLLYMSMYSMHIQVLAYFMHMFFV